MRFRKNVTASFLAMMMATTAIAGPFADCQVKADTVNPNEPGIESRQAENEEITTLIDLNTQWNYYDLEVDPAPADKCENRTDWTTYDMSQVEGWKGTSSDIEEVRFGAKYGELASVDGYQPSVLLKQYKDDSTDTYVKDTEAFFFRTTVDVKEKPDEDDLLKGTIHYDDGAIVYLNGEQIAEFHNQHCDSETGKSLGEKFTANMQYGGHNQNVTEGTFEVDADMLDEGENIIAVELHQGRRTSSDIYFDMTSLTIEPYEVEQKAISLTVGADETSRNITWYSNEDESGSVQYAEKDGEEFPSDYKEVDATMTVAANDAGYYSNKAELSNLKSNTEYVYRLVNGDMVSPTYSFKTTGTSDFSFLLAGDPQIGASGNAGSDTQGWEATINTATENFPDAAFLMSAGDQVNTANNENQYAGYLEHSGLYSIPSATSIGNHDSGSAAYSEHFNLPNVTNYGATAAGTDYWYVYNNTLFMNINSNNLSTAEHKAMMEEAIAANPDVDWKVVFFHHSIYSVANHASEKDILNRRSEYVPVFEDLDIDVVLMGHDHVYVRSYMMDGLEPQVTDTVENSVTDPDGILYVTANSASGSKYYNIQNTVFPYAAVQSQEYTPNISNVEVTENSFKITTYRTNDMSVVDEFTINKSAKVAGETKTEVTSGKTGVENETAAVSINKVAGYDSGVVNSDGGSAEIVKYNSDNENYYVVNGTTGTLDIVPRDTDKTGIKLNLKRILEDKYAGFSYGDMTSVDVSEKRQQIAVAVQAKETNENGKVVLLNYDNEIEAIYEVGVQPDMLTFTKDGEKILTANEGEPRDGYGEGTVDPQGSVSIIDLTKDSVKTVTFESWDAKREQLTDAGVIIKKDTAPSVDLEPEYIAVNDEGTVAYVALQEANAIATLNILTGKFTAIRSLGFKDHSLEENAIDLNKDDKAANIKTEENVYGIRMPDGIDIFESNGKTYLLTANEGDSRDWEDYCNEKEVTVNGYEEVVTFDTDDYDGFGQYGTDATYLFGGRSFSIYDAKTMELVYDSGSDFETLTAKYLPEYFNCSNDKIKVDNRSGKKGPEPETVITGSVDGKDYAFVALERIGGIMVYDITDPANASFVNYINTRDFSDKIAGDVSPEGLDFVSADESISGKTELYVANEVSGTVAIYEIDGKEVEKTEEKDPNQEKLENLQTELDQAKKEAEAAKQAAANAEAVAKAEAEKKAAEAQQKLDALKKAFTLTTKAVENLTVKKVSGAKVIASWAKVEQADRYLVEVLRNGKKVKSEYTTGLTYTYKNAKAGYAYTVKVTPAIQYDGTVYVGETKKANYIVKPATPNISVKKNKTTVTVTSKKQAATGYQIQICKSKKFKSGVKKYTVKSTSLKKTIKLTSLKKGTNYIRIRAYKTYEGKTAYSKWSTVKKVNR